MNVSEKQRIRRELGARRLALSSTEAEVAGRAVASRLMERAELSRPTRVGIYWAQRGEISTKEVFHELCARGHSVFLPRLDPDKDDLVFSAFESESELLPGRFGILEPPNTARRVEAQELEIMLLPGIAFDLFGNRIGWGQGHYDRVLKRYRGHRWGLAYDFQVLASLPREAHDEGVQVVITDARSLLALPRNNE